METQICSDCHQEKGLEDFGFWHSTKHRRNDYCLACGRKRGATWSLRPRRPKRLSPKRAPRSLAEIPDGYTASIVISDERRAEIIRRIEG